MEVVVVVVEVVGERGRYEDRYVREVEAHRVADEGGAVVSFLE